MDDMRNEIKRQRKKKKKSAKNEIVNAIIGDIWYHNLTDEKRSEIRQRYGKIYGEKVS